MSQKMETALQFPTGAVIFLNSPLQDDPSKTEMSQKTETALQFPTGADLKDLEEVEGDFRGESHFYEFTSISNP